MRCLSTAETARILGVSGATIRNWSRAGHLTPVAIRPITFCEEDILALKERIRTNRFNRLRKRANKSASDKFQSPDVHDQKILADIQAFLERVGHKNVDPDREVFAAALHFLAAKGESRLPAPPAPLRFVDIAWRRKSVFDVMNNWHERVHGQYRTPTHLEVATFLGWQDVEDPLGLLYQGLSSVGEKSRAGAYFTPSEIIDASLANFADKPSSFLDPCCGTGRYLVRAAKYFGLAPESVFGFDADPVAADIARLSLLLCYPDSDFEPNIRCLDSLRDLATGEKNCDTNHLLGRIDAIATNPPWGSVQSRQDYKKTTHGIRSGESFSLFLEKSLRLLREDGALSFLLPEAVLKIRTHADIRELILAETSIDRIAMLGRVFSGVFTQIIRLDLTKRKAPPEWRVRVEGMGDTHDASQSRFASNANQAFDVAVTAVDENLLEKIFSVPHQTLFGNAEWALGIVTGDNSRCVLDFPCEDSEPVLRGRDVFKFAPREPRCHIVFRPETFQQVAPERFFRAPEKLIYRFVSDRLVFAYDSKGSLTLNSANILIPRLPDMSIKATLAFLNSRVFQYIFTKRFQTRKILRSDLETLPFPLLSLAQTRELEEQVERCMGGEYKPAEDLDRMVFAIFGITDAEIATLEQRLLSDSNRPRY